jgi:hypothetical protein
VTPEEVTKEIARIKDADNWPLRDRLHVKRWLGSGYQTGMIYTACATSGTPVPVPTVCVVRTDGEGVKSIPFESIEAMVHAGWIGD